MLGNFVYFFDVSHFFLLVNFLTECKTILSYDVASGSEITQCNKIDKQLVVYRFAGNVLRYHNNAAYVMTKLTFLCQKYDLKVILMSYDKYNLTFVLLSY